MFILDQSNSIASLYLKDLRDSHQQKDRLRFRNNLLRIGKIMAYEISKELAYVTEVTNTPLGEKECQVLQTQPVLITVLRAGIPFYNGFLDIFDSADSGFIGAYRAKDGSPEEVEIESEYKALPNLEGRDVILVDPMLATGKSLLNAVESLKIRGLPKHLYIASIIAAPEGLDYLQENLDIEYSIWTASIDEHLNNKAYIVPGLGDAGDLAFGPKH